MPPFWFLGLHPGRIYYSLEHCYNSHDGGWNIFHRELIFFPYCSLFPCHARIEILPFYCGLSAIQSIIFTSTQSILLWKKVSIHRTARTHASLPLCGGKHKLSNKNAIIIIVFPHIHAMLSLFYTLLVVYIL
jgi:hypothetical protein